MDNARKTADLGQLDSDVFLFGGPVSNHQATRAFLAVIPPGASAVCTGDVVAYCGEPAETVALVRDSGWPVVAGNVERQLAEGAGDCGCGFGDGTACDLLSRAWYAHTAAALGPEDRAWMSALPDIAVFRHRGRRYAVIHGGVTRINRFLFETSPEDAFHEEIAAVTAAAGPVDGVIAGHSGLPFLRSVAGVDWLNAGTIGLPPNDGRPLTRYAVLTDGRVQFAELDYDWRSAQDVMRAAGLTQGYDTCLETGRWPSEEILPEDLRRA